LDNLANKNRNKSQDYFDESLWENLNSHYISFLFYKTVTIICLQSAINR